MNPLGKNDSDQTTALEAEAKTTREANTEEEGISTTYSAHLHLPVPAPPKAQDLRPLRSPNRPLLPVKRMTMNKKRSQKTSD